MASAPDNSIFIVEENAVEVFRSNQKITDIPISYVGICIAATNEFVAVGGEVIYKF